MTDLEIYESYSVTEDFVTEVARVDEMAPNLFRVIVCAKQPSISGGQPERVVKAKLLMTGEGLRAISMALAAGASFDPVFAALLPTAVAN